jgi:hypothetical protein
MEEALDSATQTRACRDEILAWSCHLKVQVVMLECELFAAGDRIMLHRAANLDSAAPDWCSLDALRNHQSVLVGLAVAWERLAGIVYMAGTDEPPPHISRTRDQKIRQISSQPGWRWLEPYVPMVAEFSNLRRNPEMHARSPLIDSWLETGHTDQLADVGVLGPFLNEVWGNLVRSIAGEPHRTLSHHHLDGDEIAERYRDEL